MKKAYPTGSLSVSVLTLAAAACVLASDLTTQLPKDLAAYRKWPGLLKEPKGVPIELWIRCMAPIEADWQRAEQAHGPHNRRLIQVYANPKASSAARDLKQAFPTGSILVKEKNTLDGKPSTVGIAAMIKRDTPQFARSGGWEFVYVPNPSKADVQEGCAECHRAAPSRRFVFGPYPTGGK